MNILLINHYAGSPEYGMEYRPYYLAREWVKMGHNVTIVGANFSHLRIKQPKVNEECIDGIRYIWLETPTYQGNGMRRIKNMLSFLWKLYSQEKQINAEHKPDVVIASSTYPLDIYPAHYIAKKYKAKLVFEVHDIWPLTPMEIGHMSKYHPFIMVMQMAENFMCKHVDKLVSILPKAEEHYLEHGLAKGKFVCVPNGIIVDGKPTDSAQNSLSQLENINAIEKEHDKGNYVLLFAGAHGTANALDTLLDASKLFVDIPVTICLMGGGQEKNRLQLRVKEEKINNVIFLNPVKKNEVANILDKADVLYIGLAKTNLFHFGISPNKMMDYMLARKPIISAIDAGNDMVTEAKCGISVPAENPAAVVDAIKKLISLSNEERLVLGKNGLAYVKVNHDYKKLAVDFIKKLGN
ncbi:glycosyltransferase family 4 protein [Selenomonas ruminantium]|uniref:glycosyltransferase family 4 protein n=1 Tax=Selenomonas ruminantium TaxID=971 RepID=UPI0026E9ADC3|nr:glycosyltransferase family 4 protein [Selenomonas ruminantium]